MKHFAARTPVLLLAFAAAACSETSGPSGEIGSGVQNMPIVMGGFHINTGPVTTNQDGQSKNIVDDYVLPAQLPNVRFEVFTIHLLAPVASDVETDVDNVVVRVLRTDGVRTGNIFTSLEYAGETSFGGQRYDTWRINGFYNSATALDKSNFANVTFEADLRYEANGSTVVTRPVTLSVYKRN
jgi:hypothetical protein